MPMVRFAAAVALAVSSATAMAASMDEQMKKLALDSGCTACHERAARTDGASVPPPAPTWRAIARQYRRQPGAEDKLVTAVVRGSGPEHRHWQVTRSTMPPNATELTEPDARVLVRWILQQK